MKDRRRIIVIVIVILCFLTCLMGTICLFRYYQPAAEQIPYEIRHKRDGDTIRVLFWGDSWAAYHQEHDNQLERMVQAETGQHCRVKSIGMVGAKSKTIYNSLFEYRQEITQFSPDYCVISSGINDAVAKMGVEYYTRNYLLLLQFLLSEGIVPVVLDMPDIDYTYIFKNESLLSNLRHLLSAGITKSSLFHFNDYRKGLKELISVNHMEKSIIYIDAPAWMPKQENDKRTLFCSDRVHLNTIGYKRLDSCISTHLRLKPLLNRQSTSYPGRDRE